MELKKVAIYILTVLLFFICSTAVFAEELVIPVIKSPYKIDKTEWVNNGSQFAITTNNETYVRDTLDLSLKDKYPQKNDTERIGDFPSPVVAYGKNKNGTLAAAACEDKKVYLYDSLSGEVKSIGTHNTKSTSIAFINNNQILIADNENSAGLYSLTGEKLKTFASAQKITSVEATADGETVILGQADGSMHFYSTDNSREMGFVPALNSSGIKALAINNESTKMLATYNDGSVFYVRITDALFSPSTVAPAIKNFPIAYNALTAEEDETTKVQEFAIKEIDEAETLDTEFIASTRELKDNQKFEINEKKEKGESVIVKKNQQEKNFTYTQGTDSDITLQKKYPDMESHTYVQEFNQDLSGVGINRITPQKDVEIIQDDKGKVTEFPPVTVPNGNMYGNNSNSYSQNQKNQSYPQTQSDKNNYPQNQINQYYPQLQTSIPENTVPPQYGSSAQTNQPIVVIVNGNDSNKDNSEELKPEETKKEEKKEKAKKTEKEKKEKEPKAKKEKEPKEKKQKEEEKEREELYREGHLLIVNASVSPLQDPYTYEISLPVGYKNFNLIKPFYFGGFIEPFIGFPKSDFPYTYKIDGNAVVSPRLIGAKIYAPIGFSIRPLKNSLTIYSDLNLGLSLNSLWNEKVGTSFISSKMYPSFYGALKIGAMWRFINLDLVGSYDGITNLSIAAELGFSISIGTQNIAGGGTKK